MPYRISGPRYGSQCNAMQRKDEAALRLSHANATRADTSGQGKVVDVRQSAVQRSHHHRHRPCRARLVNHTRTLDSDGGAEAGADASTLAGQDEQQRQGAARRRTRPRSGWAHTTGKAGHARAASERRGAVQAAWSEAKSGTFSAALHGAAHDATQAGLCVMMLAADIASVEASALSSCFWTHAASGREGMASHTRFTAELPQAIHRRVARCPSSTRHHTAT